MTFEAVIFDMDGVISRTQRLHAQAQSDVLERDFSVEKSPSEITENYAGMEPGTVFREEASADDPRKAHSRKQERLYELVEEKGVEPVEGALELIEELNHYYILGVGSGSQPNFIRLVLDDLGISEYFDSYTSGSEVENGKPAPDVYLEEARRLEVDPENCIVIEDSRHGVKAARDAGMNVIGLLSDVNEGLGADLEVESLTDLEKTDIKELSEMD